MNRKKNIFFVVLLSLAFIFAIKTNYQGDITIRLNEPTSFDFSSASFSELVFYSFIYENFFYLKENGEILTHLFENYEYDKTQLSWRFTIKDNLSFSNGQPITVKDIKNSFMVFLNSNLLAAKKLTRFVKQARIKDNFLYVDLALDNPDLIYLLADPGLILLSDKGQVFSGIYYPLEWQKNSHIILTPNKFYPGGRTYLNSLKIIFRDIFYPDIFLANPGFDHTDFKERSSGVYQNIYICFPQGDVSLSTRLALYYLLKEFFKPTQWKELNSLTSNEESPISIEIKELPYSKVISMLKLSRINLYIISSLFEKEEKWEDFLQPKGLKIETIYVNDNQLINFIKDPSLKYLVVGKVFNRSMPIEEKVAKIMRELTFNQFNVKYIRFLTEMDEVRLINNEGLLMNHIAKIMENVVQDGILLPLVQKRYSIYLRRNLMGYEIDYYGRPLLQRMRIDINEKKPEKLASEKE